MSLTVAIIVNVAAMLVLLAGLAYTLASTRRLQPHRPSREADLLRLRQADDSEERVAA